MLAVLFSPLGYASGEPSCQSDELVCVFIVLGCQNWDFGSTDHTMNCTVSISLNLSLLACLYTFNMWHGKYLSMQNQREKYNDYESLQKKYFHKLQFTLSANSTEHDGFRRGNVWSLLSMEAWKSNTLHLILILDHEKCKIPLCMYFLHELRNIHSINSAEVLRWEIIYAQD